MGRAGGSAYHPAVIVWTPEREQMLRELVAAGTQYKFIAEKLGFPGHANACISKARRLRIGGKRRQYRNPGRSPQVPEPAEPEIPYVPASPQLAIIGFQLRRFVWELSLDKHPDAPHMLTHHGAES